jgi:hypothetical protein
VTFALVDAFKIVLVFVVLVVFLMRRANMGAVMTGSAILLGILFQLDLGGFWRALVQTTTNVLNVELIVALGLIMMLEALMGQEGVLQGMVTSLRGLVGDSRVVMAALPALVGLIPSAGGAIFSAPMVEEVSRGSGASAETKTFINYWYRHVWEYVLPLYPALLLTAQVYGVSVASLMLLMLPMPFLVVVFGWPTAFWRLRVPASKTVDPHIGEHVRNLAVGLGPVLTILALVLVLRMSIAIAVLLVLMALIVAYRYGPARIAIMLKDSVSLDVLFAVFAVLWFKEVLIVSGAVQALTPVLTAWHIPIAAAFVLLPLLVGVLTGSPQAVVGTAGPILIGLVGMPSVSPELAASAMVSGYAGCMLSPAHLCFVLTNGYFHADFGKSFRMVVLPELALLAASLAYLAFA